jgi:hypothetical protein
MISKVTMARRILMATCLLLALGAAPAFAQTATNNTATSDTATNKPGLFSGLFSGKKQGSQNTTTSDSGGSAAAMNKSRTHHHVHTYMARNYDHRSGHTYKHGRSGTAGTSSATTPAKSSGGFFDRFKKPGTGQ